MFGHKVKERIKVMKLYEVINPSDQITFYAPDNDVAEAVVVLLGSGRFGLRACDGSEAPETLYVFSSPSELVIARIRTTLRNRNEECRDAAKTYAVCSAKNREMYDAFTEKSTKSDKVNRWDDQRRSSESDIAGSAREWGWRKGSY